jgi:hypothetical protein
VARANEPDEKAVADWYAAMRHEGLVSAEPDRIDEFLRASPDEPPSGERDL